MGSSGLLLLGIVALWAFGAVPHWVQRREQLAAAWRAEATEEELRLLERRELSRTSSAPARSTGRLLAAPRAAAGSAPTGKGSQPVAQPAQQPVEQPVERPVERPAAPARLAPAARRTAPGAAPALLLLVGTGLVAAVPALLAVFGLVPLSAAPAGLAVLGLAVLVLRRRAAVRQRSAERAAVLQAQARTRAAQQRAVVRRDAEGRAVVAARAAAASAAAAAATFAAERAVANAEAVERASRAAERVAAAPRRRAAGE
ncbi:hypothetical protein H7K62_20165 [Quadrisphaera sp. RL12-1S]|uniref:hypothetical protein n=1 Tax=Quadrisphaera sp. RL12-1S TaxID=2763011 RepID=UPI001644DD2A|nr:hypothetical protein [Quadrisphaera sp. RL12-1S]MBC3764008.1 hypothetical protein [Quadrisphaera sp. RL12-1S]